MHHALDEIDHHALSRVARRAGEQDAISARSDAKGAPRSIPNGEQARVDRDRHLPTFPRVERDFGEGTEPFRGLPAAGDGRDVNLGYVLAAPGPAVLHPKTDPQLAAV